MSSWKTQAAEEKKKQQMLDEIHAIPEVKRIFILSDIFTTINSFLALAVLLTLCYELSPLGGGLMDVSTIFSLNGIINLATSRPLLAIVVGVAIVGYLIVRVLSKKYTAELQKMEKVHLREMEQAMADGTYVPGPTLSRGYIIFRNVRSIVIAVFAFATLGCLIVFMF